MPHKGKKYKTKQKLDNRGKLINFKSILDIENKVSNVGWFEIDTVMVKNYKYICLALVEQSSNNYFAIKLKNNTANKVLAKFKDIFINNNLIGKIRSHVKNKGFCF